MTVLCNTREPNPHPWERYLPARLEHRARLPRNASLKRGRYVRRMIVVVEGSFADVAVAGRAG